MYVNIYLIFFHLTVALKEHDNVSFSPLQRVNSGQLALYQKHLFHPLVKGKAVLLQAWGGPEGSRKLRFPDFLTTAQYVGKVVSLMHRPPLPPGNTPGTHFC
jgi:hypothetical protein